MLTSIKIPACGPAMTQHNNVAQRASQSIFLHKRTDCELAIVSQLLLITVLNNQSHCNVQQNMNLSFEY
jgi:hypothetical protein